MPDSSELKTQSDPKWLVIVVALIVVALVMSYDVMLGMVAAGIFAVVTGLFLWVSFRFAAEPGEPRSEREALGERFKRLARNRRSAQSKEDGAPRRSRSQRRANARKRT